MTDWQSMETAPKDGTRVLAIVESAYWDVGEDTWSPRSTHRPFIAVIYWGLIDDWQFEEDFGAGAEAEPTHWMPMPERPSE